jgi:hypothetical protein
MTFEIWGRRNLLEYLLLVWFLEHNVDMHELFLHVFYRVA